jgi:hypothetical protein
MNIIMSVLRLQLRGPLLGRKTRLDIDVTSLANVVEAYILFMAAEAKIYKDVADAAAQ